MPVAPHLRTLFSKPASVTWTRITNDPGSSRNAEIWIGVPGTSPSAGTISHLGDNGAYTSSGSSLTVTTDSTIGVNDVLILTVATGSSNTVSSVTHGTAGTNNVIVTMSGTASIFANVARFSGLGSSGAADVVGTPVSHTSVNPMAGPSITPNHADELFVSVGWTAGTVTGSPANSFTSFNLSTATEVGSAYLIAGDSSAHSTSWALSANAAVTVVGACFV